MKVFRFLLLFSVALLTAVPASAGHGHRARVGVYFGVPAPWYYAPAPYYYSPYRYYSAPPVIVLPPREPTVYIEHSPPAPAVNNQLPAGYWYYCQPTQAYYPYVRECSVPWQPVAPQPPR